MYIYMVWKSINQSTNEIYLSICLSVCLSARPSVHPSIHPSIHPSNLFFLSAFLSFCLSFFLSIYLPYMWNYVKRCTGRETHTHVRQSISTSSKILELCSSLLPATAHNQRNRPQPKSVIPQTSQAKTQDQPGTPKMCVANPKQSGLQ